MPSIEPFRVEFPDADLQDLRERLARTRWPEPETVDDWSQGVPLDHLQEVCAYWADGYDWRRAEARLNAFEHGRTQIDGVDIHFIHARSPEADARPLVMTHGWPGSVVEFLDVIGPLADPVAHGGDAADAFHVVCPSLPGYGFSARPSTPSWGLSKIGEAWVELMARLGYERFFSQGGDWGGLLTAQMGYEQSQALDGIHVNFAICNPEALMALGEPTAEEQGQLGAMQHYTEWENGYSQQQSTRPQTLGYGLTDSPAGQCAWILEKFMAWTDNGGRPEDAVDRDAILDNVTLYWLTGTAASSGRLYWESMRSVFTDFTEVGVPAAYSLFPHDLMTISERWMRTRYTDLRYFHRLDEGGHFAAMEEPATFVDEVRAGLRALR